MRKAKTTKAKRTATVRGAQYEYTVVFEPAEEGGYVVTVPALPGLVTEGDTLAEARAMAADAIRCYLETLQADGEEIPIEERPPEEVRQVAGCLITLPHIQVRNPAFDVVPARLITAIISERGIARPRYLKSLAVWNRKRK